MSEFDPRPHPPGRRMIPAFGNVIDQATTRAAKIIQGTARFAGIS